MTARWFPDPLGAVLLDLDGTLVDTTPDLVAAANKACIDCSPEPVDYEMPRPVASYGVRGLTGVVFGVGPGDAGLETLRLVFLAGYEAETCVRTQLFPGMADVLAELDRAGTP